VEIDLFKDPLPGTANGDSFRSLRKPLYLKSLGYPFAPHEAHRALEALIALRWLLCGCISKNCLSQPQAYRPETQKDHAQTFVVSVSLAKRFDSQIAGAMPFCYPGRQAGEAGCAASYDVLRVTGLSMAEDADL
jgi:hypothetical protein